MSLRAKQAEEVIELLDQNKLRAAEERLNYSENTEFRDLAPFVTLRPEAVKSELKVIRLAALQEENKVEEPLKPKVDPELRKKLAMIIDMIHRGESASALLVLEETLSFLTKNFSSTTKDADRNQKLLDAVSYLQLNRPGACIAGLKDLM